MKYDTSKHQEGTPASVRYAKSMTPGENNKKEKKMKDFHEFRKEVSEEGGVKSGHKRSVAQGAGLTQKGVDAENRKTGGNLKTAVTTPPSKLKPGSKAAGRRKSFCARSRGWTGERGKAARKRWNC